MKNQRGYLLVLAALLIVVMGFLGIAVSYMYIGSSTANINFLQSSKAFYIAEGGLEKATRYLSSPFLTGVTTRVACASLNGNSNITNSSLGNGTFTVTRTGSPVYANSTLSAAITSTSTALTVANAAGFSASGRVIVDNEAIEYAAISGTTLVGLIRGVNKTLASSHSSGASVSQYQCNIDSQGGVPSIASPTHDRELQQAVQLQDAWVVGASNGNNFTFSHWNYPTELSWTNASFTDSTNRDDLQGVSLLSNTSGWAVGNDANSNFTILRLNGTAWTFTPLAGACSGQILYSVSAVSSQEAWAVGARQRPTNCSSGNYRYTILKWNGSTWTELAPATIPADNNSNQNLNSVSVIDTSGNGTGDIGFAVGNSGVILRYNGSTWAANTSGVTNNLFSVYTVSGSEAWAVGASGRILKWNGSSWSAITSPTTNQLNSVFMYDSNGDGLADAGWAVGASGTAIRYNGSTWSTSSPGGGALQTVVMFNANDAWAAGASGAMFHWDGSAWTSFSSGTTTTLYKIAIVSPKNSPESEWSEVVP